MGISSDGDSRLLSTMKTLTSFDLKIANLTEFVKQMPYSIQDMIHIGTKLRNRLLNSSIIMCIGTHIVTILHIKILLDTVAKEVHGLVSSDIFPEDRQNYGSLEKLMDDRVINALKEHVADSEATIMYLKLCKLITSSFLSIHLKPVERIYNIWFAIYFIRCWRKWLKSQKDYSFDENFISDNAYTCLEINAHNLIQIILKLRNNEQDSLFLPHLFASQPCEHIFRMMKSMGTQNFTKINFTLNELLHLVSRVELMQKISYDCGEIDFPRVSKEASSHGMQLPSDLEISHALETAQKDALEKAAGFGIFFTTHDIASTEMSQRNSGSTECGVKNSSENDSDDDLLVEENTPDVASPFLDLMDPDGTTRRVLKTTFIWNYTQKDKLSADRSIRVRGSSSSKRRKYFSNSMLSVDPVSNQNLVKSTEINIGDWVVFNLRNGTITSELKDELLKKKNF